MSVEGAGVGGKPRGIIEHVRSWCWLFSERGECVYPRDQDETCSVLFAIDVETTAQAIEDGDAGNEDSAAMNEAGKVPVPAQALVANREDILFAFLAARDT